MTVPELVDHGVGYGQALANRVAPAMAALGSGNLTGISGIGAVQRVNSGIPLPAPAQEDLHLVGDIGIALDGELVFVAVVRIVEAEAAGVQSVARVAVIRVRYH